MNSFRQFIESTNYSLEHEVLSLYRSTQSHVKQISEITGVSVGGIYRILEKHGIKPHRRNMNNSQYDTIQQYYNSGISAQRISELTGYSTRQVYNIIAKSSNLGNETFS